MAFLLLFGLALLYGRANFYRDPLSVFFDPERARTRWYSAFREYQANVFIDQVAVAHSQGVAFQKAGKRPRLCASFLTTKREGPQYIEVNIFDSASNTLVINGQSSIGSALEGLTEAERSALYLAVFFTNSDPTVHPTWKKPWLRGLLDEVYTYNTTASELQKLQQFEIDQAVKPKGVFDYTYALRHCYDHGAEWIAIFEGDVIFAHGWFAKTLDGLWQIKDVLRKRPNEWLFMRLFNQERSTGWSSRRIGRNNEHWISLGVGTAMAAMLLTLRRKSPAIKKYVDNGTVLVICCIAIPTFVILFFQAGKASMLPPSPGVRVESFGCCSQAMVFPREQIPPTVQYLREKEEGQVDLMLNDRSRATGLARIALYPVQVQHIGELRSFPALPKLTNSRHELGSRNHEFGCPGYLEHDI